MREGSEKSLVMVLKELVPLPDSVGTEGKKREDNLSSAGEPSPPPPARTFQPPVPFPQRLAWSKLSQFEPRFV